ncbi:MAG: hypothetical protein KC535_05055, partial [Nanoarchaeota archaeon]|nr:hypothetical protein [Nanoarchaeota archaeon]
HLHNYGENKNRIFELIDYTPFKQQQKSKKNENHSEIFEKLEKTFGYSTLNPSPQDLKTSKIDHKRYQATKSGIVTADGYTTYEYREDLKDTTYKAENQIITITNNHLIIGTYFDQPTTEFIREHQKEIDSIGAVVEKQWLEQEKN